MKSSEAAPLSQQELATLENLFKRWVLLTYPIECGSSEWSDALQTYYDVRRDNNNGCVRLLDEEEKEWNKKYKESVL